MYMSYVMYAMYMYEHNYLFLFLATSIYSREQGSNRRDKTYSCTLSRMFVLLLLLPPSPPFLFNIQDMLHRSVHRCRATTSMKLQELDHPRTLQHVACHLKKLITGTKSENKSATGTLTMENEVKKSLSTIYDQTKYRMAQQFSPDCIVQDTPGILFYHTAELESSGHRSL